MAVLDASRPPGLRFARRVSSRVIFVGVLLILAGLFATDGIAQTKPGTPTNLTATPGDRKVILSWDAPSGTVTDYEYKHGIGTWQSIGSTNTTYTINGAINGSIVGCDLRAVNGATKGDTAHFPSVTPNIPAPTALTATAGDGEVTLRWTKPSDLNPRPGAPDLSRYEYTTDDGSTWTTTGGTGTSYTVTGLTNGQEYTFKVRAVRVSTLDNITTTDNGLASDPGVSATPMLSPPAAPTGFSATPGDGKVTLRWTAPSGPITGYQYSQNGGGWTSTGWTPATGTSTIRTVIGLTNGTTYTFKVRAVNSGGNGAESGQASATPDASAPPPPPPPPPVIPPGDINAGTTETLTVRRVNSRTVTLSWDIPTALNAQTIAYEYSTNAGQTWTSTNSRNTSITLTGDGFGDLPPTQFRIRAMNQNADGTQSFVIISASATQRQRRIIQECPVGWIRSDGFAGRNRRALLYEVKLEMELHNPISIYKPVWVAIYVHPDEGLEHLEGWKLQVALPYNRHSEYLLTAENSVVVDAGFVEGGFAFIESPQETPFPMTGMGFPGSPAPGFDYRLYDETGRRVDFGISCYKRFDVFQVLKDTEDPRVLRKVLLESFDWDSHYLRSEWTVVTPAPAAPSQIKGNMVGTWADLKKQ